MASVVRDSEITKNPSDFKPVSRKKAQLTDAEINKKKEDAFFANFQTTQKNVIISGASSWRSSSINGIYKPEAGQYLFHVLLNQFLDYSFFRQNHPNVHKNNQ